MEGKYAMIVLNETQTSAVCGGFQRGDSLLFKKTASSFGGVTGGSSDGSYQDALEEARGEYERLIAQGVDPLDALADGLAAAGF